jgi:NTE family protein
MFAPASRITDFQKLPIPFSCVATDLVTGEIKEFRSGSLMQGVRASMSVPSVLQPFPLKNKLYIDGGISQNLPGKQVKAMGADFVIGLKVTSSLRQLEKLPGLIQVLDQTINIGMISRMNEELDYCDFILSPDLSSFSVMDFTKAKAIIATGEQYAREHITELSAILGKKASGSKQDSLKLIIPNTVISKALPPITKVRFHRIQTSGNVYLSSAKLREYIGIETERDYTILQIKNHFQTTWNSQLFDIIYPLIVPDEAGYMLVIVVKERERKYLSLNFAYDKENEFMAGAVLSLHNYILKNSHLFAELQLGGKRELNIDLVKNFGDAYGIYYRLFPYINEKRIYFYNESHDKISSARSLEEGLTSGIGIYARKSIVLEGYGFAYKNTLYKEIALTELLSKAQTVSGIGVKLYHESTDDYTFPMHGVKAMIKASFAREDLLSDETVNKLLADVNIYHRFANDLSIFAGMQYGSHFKQNLSNPIDPFYLGGLDCFAAYPKYEKSAPFYKLIQAGVTISPYKRFFFSTRFQALNYANNDIWNSQQGFILGSVLEAGVNSILGPVRLSAAVTDDRPVALYLNIGFTNDIFHFSRR